MKGSCPASTNTNRTGNNGGWESRQAYAEPDKWGAGPREPQLC